MFEIVRKYCDASSLIANINPVYSRVHIGLASRMNVPRRDLLKNLLYLRP